MRSCPECAALCYSGHSYCVACGAQLARKPMDPRQVDPLVGSTLAGGYRITHLVGVGGMGRVYCAQQVALGRTVAVKIVHPQLADDDLAAARFLNEARAASQLSHPNSVAIFDFGQTADGAAYIVMEYLRGRDLARVSQTEGPLPLRRVVHILQQVLAALDEAHALGIVHRDVKPDNIVLEPLKSGLDFVKVVDFGLAKLLRESDKDWIRQGISQPGLVCGTPEYMSPEQGRGDPLDGRSDIYSVGIVLFELLTGQLPFVGQTQTKTLLLHMTEPIPDPRDIAPDHAIPGPFAQLVLRALAKSREDRPESAGAFADALRDALLEAEGRISFDPTPVTAIRCAGCGKLTPIGQRFCGECGIPMSTRPVSAPPPVSASRTAEPPVSASRRSEHQRGSRATEGPYWAKKADRWSWTDIAERSMPSANDDASNRPPAFLFADAGSSSLLAREEAQLWLEARRQDASAMPACAHLIGEAGMGKTRLLEDALARWSARGDYVVRVGPDPTCARVGDSTVRAAIRKLARWPEGPVDARAWGAASREAQKGLLTLFAHNPPALQPFERRAVVAEALRWALEVAEGRSGAARVVLAVDDLDFVDGTSRNAISDVLDAPPPARVMLVVTYAPSSLPVSDPVAGEAFRIGPLPFESFATLLPPGLGPQTALSPLHVQQLLLWAADTTELPPENLPSLIARRAERLPLNARNLLHGLIIWGDGGRLDDLVGLFPEPADDASALEVLKRSRMVVVESGIVRIAHPLFRRILLTAMPAERRQELCARCLELRPEAPLELRAKLAIHAGGALEALSLLDALAARRASQGDLLGAVSALQHALDHARHQIHRGELDDPSAAILVFSRRLAEALAASQRWSDADGVLREALGNAAPTSQHRAHLLSLLARVAHARRQTGDARRYLDEAIRVARQSDASGLLPMLERLDRAIAVA